MRTIEYLQYRNPTFGEQIVWEGPGQNKPSALIQELFAKFGHGTNWEHINDMFYSGFYRLNILYKLQNQLTAVGKALGGVISGKDVLDLGCGAKSGTADVNGGNLGYHEPWLARVLHRLNAKVVGVDVGDLSQEEFENYNLDLLNPDALNIFADQSFDVVHSSALYTSPELQRRRYGWAGDGSINAAWDLARILKPQIERVLKPNGVYLIRERFDYLIPDSERGELLPIDIFRW